MPGSQTELAVITADFIKVYDLGSDALSPQYFLLVMRAISVLLLVLYVYIQTGDVF